MWQWPDAFDGISKQDASDVRTAIAAMAANPPSNSSKSATWAGYIIADTLNIDADDEAGRSRIKEMLKYWIKTDVLAIEEQHDRQKGRTKKVVIAGPNNPNSVSQG